MLDSFPMRPVPLRACGLAVLSALLQLLPFPLAGPVPAWRRFFCWFCLLPLLYALGSRDAEGRPLTLSQSSLIGYICGICWFCGNCYWIYQTMFLYGGLPAPVALGILILFSLYLGLYFALFGFCFALLRTTVSERTAISLSPLLWVAVELARARVTGFPWDLLGYTQVDSAFFTRLAPWTGVMGLSLVVAAVNAVWLWTPKHALQQGWVRPLRMSVLIAVFAAGFSSKPPRYTPTATAVLLQDNLRVGAEAHESSASASEMPSETQSHMLADFSARTLNPARAPQLSEIGSASENASRQASPKASNLSGDALSPRIILWPEAPTTFMSADPQFRAAVGQVARAAQAPLVVDAVGQGTVPNHGGHFDEFVSASFFLPDGAFAGRYDKMHLVPFGEYTPYKQLFFFAGHLLDGLNFVPGTERRLFSVDGHRYGVFICYESIFGDEIREFAASGAQVLVNLSDDGWYGDTSAPWEHLDMARMRAIENRRWLLRDTNTGFTASIDPAGRIVSCMPRHIRGAIEVPFGYKEELTFYTRHGDWIGWLCAIAVTGVLGGSYLQRRYPAKSRIPATPARAE